MSYMFKAPNIRNQFNHLVEEHGDRIFNLALMRSNDRDLAQDISQETFLRVYKGLAKFRNESELGTWLYRIALNVCHTTLAQEGSRASRNQDLDVDQIELEDNEPSVETQYMKTNQAEEIRKAIGALPQEQGDAITLYYLKEFQYSEVADIMNIPLNTVKSHLRRAKIKLRKLLNEERSQ
jgi:RNA polymerase sigma-70 factor (ECF subfamily)